MDTTTRAAAVVLFALLAGCYSPPDGATDSVPSAQATDAGVACKLDAGAYRTHWTVKQSEPPTTCPAVIDLDVVSADPGYPCEAIGQVRSGVFEAGECSIGCYYDTTKCIIYAAVACPSCQGSYRVTFTPTPGP
jgi:hypothetical protein